ncbi:unnamed protein product [Rhodiola kirilowii]
MHHLQRLMAASATAPRSLPWRIDPRGIETTSQVLTMSSKSKNGDDEWNEAWETAWLPEDMKGKNRAPWEADVNFPSSPSPSLDSDSKLALEPEVDSETKAFVEDMTENWEQRKKKQQQVKEKSDSSLYTLENIKKDYRLRKQRVHAGFCSEIFDSPSSDLSYAKVPTTSEFKNKPDGWETTAKAQDGNVWEMSQREEDILLQEYERRIAYSKFQIASFIKTHIFSRRRPIDGWKYMIEEIGPNAKKGKGSAPRIPTLSDPSTQPFREERPPMDNRRSPPRQR